MPRRRIILSNVEGDSDSDSEPDAVELEEEEEKRGAEELFDEEQYRQTTPNDQVDQLVGSGQREQERAVAQPGNHNNHDDEESEEVEEVVEEIEEEEIEDLSEGSAQIGAVGDLGSIENAESVVVQLADNGTDADMHTDGFRSCRSQSQSFTTSPPLPDVDATEQPTMASHNVDTGNEKQGHQQQSAGPFRTVLPQHSRLDDETPNFVACRNTAGTANNDPTPAFVLVEGPQGEGSTARRPHTAYSAGSPTPTFVQVRTGKTPGVGATDGDHGQRGAAVLTGADPYVDMHPTPVFTMMSPVGQQEAHEDSAGAVAANDEGDAPSPRLPDRLTNAEVVWGADVADYHHSGLVHLGNQSRSSSHSASPDLFVEAVPPPVHARSDESNIAHILAARRKMEVDKRHNADAQHNQFSSTDPYDRFYDTDYGAMAPQPPDDEAETTEAHREFKAYCSVPRSGNLVLHPSSGNHNSSTNVDGSFDVDYFGDRNATSGRPPGCTCNPTYRVMSAYVSQRPHKATRGVHSGDSPANRPYDSASRHQPPGYTGRSPSSNTALSSIHNPNESVTSSQHNTGTPRTRWQSEQ